MELKDSVKTIKGIGGKKEAILKTMGIYTIEDLLFYYPRSYQDRREIKLINDLVTGTDFTVKAKVVLVVPGKNTKSRKQTLKLLVSDKSGAMEVVFFNAKYLSNTFIRDKEYYFYGKITIEHGRVQMIHPEFLAGDQESYRGILPIYSLSAGISQTDIYKCQRGIAELVFLEKEALTDEILKEHRLCGISYALENIHFPKNSQKLKEAKFRLIFDELLFLQLGLLSSSARTKATGDAISFSTENSIDEFINSFPYKLTGAQERTVKEIIVDMEADKIMGRLVQGDVGSGKTAVAEIALYKAVKSGYQGVLMAPTELLAKQHFSGLQADFSKFGITVGFLSGSMTAREKEKVLSEVADGILDIIVGTHAIIQPNVNFKNLGLVITDEQHRFGVNQRNKLAEKGNNPDILVMTATPIPRTLAAVIYGDLDISIIDELPPGRQKIITRGSDESGRAAAYEFVRHELKVGRQAYIVAPLIDVSENLNAKSAEEIFAELSKSMKEFKIALLHGEMKQKEKDDVMEGFNSGEIKLIVSTVVIEVGINVPNATIMLVENAERFGLAQLHQLRGRVGRGREQSYCILVSEGKNEIALERMKIMVSTSDGFVIAEKDLELRGPGEFFGTRQHGIPELRIANLIKHIYILNQAKEVAKKILNEDPDLSMKKNVLLRERTDRLFRNTD